MATIEQRITALEQHHGKDSINVFLFRWADEVPITRATHGGLTWLKRDDETQDEFEDRAAMEARKLPRDGAVRVFNLWLSGDGLKEIA